MFYEVRVLDGKGDLKKVISPKRLSARFWQLQADGMVDNIPRSSGEDKESNLEPAWNAKISRGESPVLELDESFEG
ncbi:MAG: hypothetical protein ACQ9MH_10155 [Nitrospinales bacterium]